MSQATMDPGQESLVLRDLRASQKPIPIEAQPTLPSELDTIGPCSIEPPEAPEPPEPELTAEEIDAQRQALLQKIREEGVGPESGNTLSYEDTLDVLRSCGLSDEEIVDAAPVLAEAVETSPRDKWEEAQLALLAAAASSGEELPSFVSLFPGEQEAAQFMGRVWQDILGLWCQNDRIVAVLTDPANVERVQAMMEAIQAPASDPRKQQVVQAEKAGIQIVAVPGIVPFQFVRLSDSIAFKEAAFLKHWAAAEVPVIAVIDELKAPVMLSTNDIRLLYLISEVLPKAMEASPSHQIARPPAGLNLNHLLRR